MKIEFICSECRRSFLLDERMVEGADAVPCPGCTSMMRSAARVRGASKAQTANGTTSQAAAPAATPATPVQTAMPAAQPAAQPAAASPAPAQAPAAPMPASATVAAPVAAQPAAPASASAATAATTPVPRVQGSAAPAMAAPAPQAAPTECVCPRCGLHFQPEQTAQHTAAQATERHRVLVVEDQEYFREIAKDALSEKFEVTTAENAEDAWRALAAGGISLLVLDLTLGGSESGRRLLEQIKVKPCPVLIFTSRDESEMYGDEWDELQALGADDMVIKGMNVGESLMRKVCELLGCADDSIDLD